METNEVIEFVDVAQKYCSLLESLDSVHLLDEVSNIAISLSELYSKALKLPHVEAESDEIPKVTVGRPQISFGKYESY